jgi:hypothetical protein
MLYAKSKSAIVVSTLFIFLLLIFINCLKIENKEYVKTKVLKMYEGYTTHPFKDLANRLNNAISSSGNIYNIDVTKYFNEKCADFIEKDPLLVKYFEGFINRCEDNGLTIYSLNYYGVPVRQQLQKELGVELLQ